LYTNPYTNGSVHPESLLSTWTSGVTVAPLVEGENLEYVVPLPHLQRERKTATNGGQKSALDAQLNIMEKCKDDLKREFHLRMSRRLGGIKSVQTLPE